MSAYQLQQLLFDQLRRWADDRAQPITAAAYTLTDDERRAVDDNDIAALYTLGVHPVLLNAWCRATGYTRDDYRALLAPLRRPSDREPRWRTSS